MILETIERNTHSAATSRNTNNFFQKGSNKNITGTYRINDDVLYIVMKGEIRLKTSKHGIILHEREMILLHQGEEIDFSKTRSSPECDFSCIYIFLDPIILSKCNPNKRTGYHSLLQELQEKHTMTNDEYSCSRFIEQNIKDNFDNSDRLLHLTGMIMDFIYESNHKFYVGIRVAISLKNIDVRQAIIDSGCYSTKELSKLLHITTQQMSKLSKSQCNVPVTKLINDLRIIKTNELLFHSDTPIKEITEIMGFHRQSDFIRSYRKSNGIPPGKARKKHKLCTQDTKNT